MCHLNVACGVCMSIMCCYDVEFHGGVYGGCAVAMLDYITFHMCNLQF